MLNPCAYCRECGCKILMKEDVGYRGTEVEPVLTFGNAVLEYIEIPFVICRSCMDETERDLEEFLTTAPSEFEAAFDRMAQKEAGI